MMLVLSSLGYFGQVFAEDEALDSTHLSPGTLTPNKEQLTLEGGPFITGMILCYHGLGNCKIPITSNQCPVGYQVNPTPTMSIVDWYNPGNCFVEGFDTMGSITQGDQIYLNLESAYGTTGRGCANYTSVQLSVTIYCDPVSPSSSGS